MGQQGAGSSRTPHGLALPRDCSALEDHLQSESARGRATPDRILADMDPLQRVTREGYLLSTITPPSGSSASVLYIYTYPSRIYKILNVLEPFSYAPYLVFVCESNAQLEYDSRPITP